VADDRDLLWTYLHLAVFVPPGGTSPPQEIVREPPLARYAAGWGRPHDSGFVAVQPATGADVGAVWLRLWSDNDAGYGYVDPNTPELSMSVRAEHRGRGIGGALLERLLRRADLRYPAVSLSVSVSNPARRLYERSGFVVVRTQQDAVIMLRHNPAAASTARG
jgi:ribosomal protein S18 acetylase RimI-like enzyme